MASGFLGTFCQDPALQLIFWYRYALVPEQAVVKELDTGVFYTIKVGCHRNLFATYTLKIVTAILTIKRNCWLCDVDIQELVPSYYFVYIITVPNLKMQIVANYLC
jgi:hypothetical protein